MPDIVRLRYTGDVTVMVAALGQTADPDCIVDFGGAVLEDNDDHYLIESGNPPETRAWPKSRWRNETTVKKPSKE